MELQRQRPLNAADTPIGATLDPCEHLQGLVLGTERPRGLEPPPWAELVTAIIQVAGGERPKVLLPLPASPAELAVARQGRFLAVTCYDTGPTPEILVPERLIEAASLLSAATAAARHLAGTAEDAPKRQLAARLLARAESATVRPSAFADLEPVRRRGGPVQAPSADVPLTFGFSARIAPGSPALADATSRADVHALLFEGALFGFVRGRKIELERGPVLLPALRMLSAARLLVDSWQAGRCTNVRLRTGGFVIGLRLDRHGEVTVSLGAQGGEVVTARALDVPGATLPILRLVSEMLRALVAVDRGQAKNLRVRGTRDEVRALRRSIRSHSRAAGFVNRDPDRLRAHAEVASTSSAGAEASSEVAAPRAALRFSERWCVDIDEVDAGATFLCGDRLVIASPRRVIAVSRDQGELLWARRGHWTSSLMAGTTLVHVTDKGDVELCDVDEGESFARSKALSRGTAAPRGVYVAGGPIPPAVVLMDGTDRMVAVDLRTGQSRWDYVAKTPTPLRVTRAGRILVVVSAHGVDGVDATSGEVVWRVPARERLAHEAVVVRDVAVVSGHELGAKTAVVFGIDVFTGEVLFRRELETPALTGPLSLGSHAAISTGIYRRASLHALDPMTGATAWCVADPGVAAGGAGLSVDSLWVVNAPTGRVTALDVETGSTAWRRDLADPVADELPRRLEPVLRGGALFVPAAAVHVVRTADGTSIGQPLPCSLVPDWIRVDERGWVYVAEESGHIGAYAPVPHLSLVRGSE